MKAPKPPAQKAAPVGIRKQLLKDGARDAELSQQAILEAATAEFAARGLEGARVDQIAQAAGINKQLLYRYFGSKDELYLRVLEDVYYRFREEETRLELHRMEPVEAIRTFVGALVERVQHQHHFARLVTDENFHEGRHLQHSHRVRALHAELLQSISEVLHRGQQAGVFRPDIDALQLFTSIGALGTFYVTNMHTLSAIFGERFDELNHVEVLRPHVQEMVLRYLLVDPGGAALR